MAVGEKVFAEVAVGDRVRLTRQHSFWRQYKRDWRTFEAGLVGTVTMKCRDGLKNTPLARVRFDDREGEPFFAFPTTDLDFLA